MYMNREKRNFTIKHLSTWLLTLLGILLAGISLPAYAAGTNQSGWAYSVEGLSLQAENSKTGETAFVSLNGNGLFLSERTGLDLIDSNLVQEENWLSNSTIDGFSIYYEGITADGAVFRSYQRPTAPGSYSARLLLPAAGLYSERLYFYQATLKETAYTVKNHSSEDALAAEAFIKCSEDGYYQVGSVEELLYVASCCGMDAKIEITEDIVYNPISIDQNGKIMSAVPVIYTWNPIGTEKKPFTGSIKGNGHTIYGLYNQSNCDYKGLIGCGEGCSVTDLTLSDCVFDGDDNGFSGAFIGMLKLSSSTGKAIVYRNLRSVDCVINGKYAGGILGAAKTVEEKDLHVTEVTYTKKRNYLTISECISESNVYARYYGGGMLGNLDGGTVVTIEHCLNAGAVTSEKDGGGIIGRASGFFQRIFIKKCLNTAGIRGDFNAGGIIGYLDLTDPSGITLSELKKLIPDPDQYRLGDTDRYYGDIRIDHCYSLGEASGLYGGGILGDYKESGKDLTFGTTCMVGCRSTQEYPLGSTDDCGDFNNYTVNDSTWKILYDSVAVKTVTTDLKHFSEGFYQIGDGKGVKHCLICGIETESAKASAHTHLNQGGQCAVCGEAMSASCSHSFIYAVYETRLLAWCTKCHRTELSWIEFDGKEHALSKKDFCNCNGLPDPQINQTEGWDSTLAPVRLVYVSSSGTTRSYTRPTSASKLGSVYAEAYSGSTTLAAMTPITFSAVDITYSVSENRLLAWCPVCNRTEYAWIEFDGEANPASEYCLCERTPDIQLKKTEGWDSSMAFVRLVYVSRDKKKESYVKPTEGEKIGSIYAEAYTGKKKTTTLAKTNPVSLSVLDHRWEYSAEEYTLYAECSSCKANASVSINQDGAYTANLEAVPNTFSGIDYEVFIDNGWLDQKGIANFYVLYDGISAKADYKIGEKYRSFKRPDGPGNYQAVLALVSDPLDPDTAYLMTRSIQYYLATIPLSECEVRDYSLAQLRSYKLPELKDGYYQVGTPEELMAVVFLQDRGVDIELTADIVMNPIRVDEDGFVYSGTYSIYNWIPLGSKITEGKTKNEIVVTSDGYYGTIRGNGHVISGLYNESEQDQMGLVRQSFGCEIQNLILENCVFNASISAGTFIGQCLMGNTELRYLQSLHCRISANCDAGGITGKVAHWYIRNPATFVGCNSNSLIKSQSAAGGILGCQAGENCYFLNCRNYGTVQGNSNAGGILGEAVNCLSLTFSWCVNIGPVSASSNCGGIAGSLSCVKANDGALIVSSCISLGKLNLAGHTGGIAGSLNASGTVYWWSNSYSQTRVAVGNSNATTDVSGTKLDNSTKHSYICTTYSEGKHQVGSHWETVTASGCGKEGKQVKRCMVCGEVMEERTIPAHDHQTEYGACNFCGEKADSTKTASVFINSSRMVIPMAAIIAAGAVVLIIRKTKHRQEDDRDERKED